MNKMKPVFEEYGKVMSQLEQSNKYSKPLMTKYEFNMIIGCRTNQLSLGAFPFVDTSDIKIKSNTQLREIALKEFNENRLPFMIKRILPNNKIEYYRIKDMDLTHIKDMIR